MSTTLLEQLRELSPSAKENLFRRLMAEESLGYLREKNSIVGFEVNLAADQVLSGFTLIAIQKHTIYAFCSDFDLQEEPKLILFPPSQKAPASLWEWPGPASIQSQKAAGTLCQRLSALGEAYVSMMRGSMTDSGTVRARPGRAPAGTTSHLS